MPEAPDADAAQLLCAGIFSTKFAPRQSRTFFFAAQVLCCPPLQRNRDSRFPGSAMPFPLPEENNVEYLKAFIVGGLLCLIGQVLIDKTKWTPARILVGYVTAGVLLGAIGLYEPLIDFAGAGASVPLTGFGNLLATGVKKAVNEDGFLGILTGGLKASSGGITAAIIFGLISGIFFKAKDRS